MRQLLKGSGSVIGIIGLLLGIVLMLATEQFDRLTTSDAFCATSCHSMQTYVADEQTYKTSVHRTTTSGVQAGCADCHVPKGLIAASWSHLIDGSRDLFAELGNDYKKPELWQARRDELAWQVRDKMLADNSRNCRSCHKEKIIQTQRLRAQRQHELALREKVTCIGCHFNLVHAEVKPRKSFLDKVRIDIQP
jgi:cytochrome c-type protein NapC